jgi:hypothetical protein
LVSYDLFTELKYEQPVRPGRATNFTNAVTAQVRKQFVKVRYSRRSSSKEITVLNRGLLITVHLD